MLPAYGATLVWRVLEHWSLGEFATMPYKGGDLDLRSAGPIFAEAWGRGGVAGPNPIVADELVLACCNRAYDVAHFHGSADVRLDHLLHALTHLPAAAQVLADLGIRTEALRRETATAIAADTPAGPADRGNGPRASAALSDALRRAADPALAQHLPASVHDLLRALLGGGPGSPAAHLLMRAAVDPQRLERWREEPHRDVLASPASRTLPSVTQEALLDRLGRLEGSLRALCDDMAGERKATGDLLRAVQAELQTFRAGGVQVRGETVDAVLEAKLSELGARLEAVEGRIGAQTTELADTLASALTQRLQETAERHWQSAGAQPLALEASAPDQLSRAEEERSAREHELQEIHEAVAQLGTGQQLLTDNLASWRAESGGDTAIVSNRLDRLEHNVLDLLDRLNAEPAPRYEQLADERPPGNGFKRWLYGTGTVFATRWRDEVASIRRTLNRSRGGEK